MLTTTEHMDQATVAIAIQAGGGTAVAGPLNSSKLILCTNRPTITKVNQVTDFTQPTYTGYAPYALTWSAASRNGIGDIVSRTQELVIQMTAAGATVPIQGYAVVDAAIANVLMSELFATPINLTDPLSWAALIVEWDVNNPNSGTGLIVL
jgi:hypothetical protein